MFATVRPGWAQGWRLRQPTVPPLPTQGVQGGAGGRAAPDCGDGDGDDGHGGRRWRMDVATPIEGVLEGGVGRDSRAVRRAARQGAGVVDYALPSSLFAAICRCAASVGRSSCAAPILLGMRLLGMAGCRRVQQQRRRRWSLAASARVSWRWPSGAVAGRMRVSSTAGGRARRAAVRTVPSGCGGRAESRRLFLDWWALGPRSVVLCAADAGALVLVLVGAAADGLAVKGSEMCAVADGRCGGRRAGWMDARWARARGPRTGGARWAEAGLAAGRPSVGFFRGTADGGVVSQQHAGSESPEGARKRPRSRRGPCKLIDR